MPSVLSDNPLPVLVVDDDSALIRTLADILRMHGYDPQTASSGLEGLKLAATSAPALAVVDLRLPDMDGVELAARLHELSEITQVVVLTGNASVESAIAAMRERSIDYLVKPVQIDRLLQVVSMAGERWQRRLAEERLKESAETLAVRVRQQAAVAEFGQRALALDDVGALFTEATHLVARTLDVPMAAVLERRADGQSLYPRSTFGFGAEVGPATNVALSEATLAGCTILGGEPLIVPDLTIDPRYQESFVLRAYRVRSAISVVIPGAVHPCGALQAFATDVREFTQDDVYFLTAIAHVIGTTVERHRAERAFRQSQRLEAVGRLASGVAHDFNNMLSAMTGYTEIVLQDLKPDDPHRDDLKEVLSAASRAAGLTRQLLAFSRQQVMQPRLMSMNDVVTGMEKMVQRLIGQEIQLSIQLDPNVDWVKADPGQLEQVLLNLCVNARDAMPNGGRLTIETANTRLDASRMQDHTIASAEPGDYVMLAVTDTGTGMDADTRARIFEPFFTTKGPEKGTGLGLATVYGIVKQSAGEIFVYSEVGHGSSFKVFLPRSTEMPGATETPAPAHEAKPGSETVLVAEDEEAIRRIMQKCLTRAGYDVILAFDGEDAMKILASHDKPIDLLITDMVMPNMNGSDLAARAREKHPGLRVLFLSGFTAASMTAVQAIGADDFFLQKPFGAEALVQKAREVLDAA
ncbi:MAG TPA: response regulator [Gemmatimonadaceae bacterium]|nr:response regulator [Gemmatimonadaceae bacterium]